jgi:hypothetical protein
LIEIVGDFDFIQSVFFLSLRLSPASPAMAKRRRWPCAASILPPGPAQILAGLETVRR